MKLQTVYPMGNKRIELTQGSITEYVADAVVCPANADLAMLAIPGGLQYAILRDGGTKIFKEAGHMAQRWEREHNSVGKGVPEYSAHATTAGSLPAKYVIHSVSVAFSPSGGLFCDKDVIGKSTENVLQKCDELKLNSVGFPTLGTGLYGVPIEDSALSIATTSAKHLRGKTSLEKVGLVIYSHDDYSVVKAVLDESLM